MKVYLASAFKFRAFVERLAQVLTDNGHVVDDKWWDTDHKDRVGDAVLFASLAKRHWAAIHDCGVLVLVNGDAELPHKFTGANVEVGYALAIGKPVFTVGPMEVSAMYADTLPCVSVQDLVYYLGIVDHYGRPLPRRQVPA